MTVLTRRTAVGPAPRKPRYIRQSTVWFVIPSKRGIFHVNHRFAFAVMPTGRLALTERPKGLSAVKSTRYFASIRRRPDRARTRDEWIEQAVASPSREEIQADGRTRRWAKIEEVEGGKYLRVILLPDGETVRNAFFDRGYKALRSSTYKTPIRSISSSVRAVLPNPRIWTRTRPWTSTQGGTYAPLPSSMRVNGRMFAI